MISTETGRRRSIRVRPSASEARAGTRRGSTAAEKGRSERLRVAQPLPRRRRGRRRRRRPERSRRRAVVSPRRRSTKAEGNPKRMLRRSNPLSDSRLLLLARPVPRRLNVHRRLTGLSWIRKRYRHTTCITYAPAKDNTNESLTRLQHRLAHYRRLLASEPALVPRELHSKYLRLRDRSVGLLLAKGRVAYLLASRLRLMPALSRGTWAAARTVRGR